MGNSVNHSTISHSKLPEHSLPVFPSKEQDMNRIGVLSANESSLGVHSEHVKKPRSFVRIVWNTMCSVIRFLFPCFFASRSSIKDPLISDKPQDPVIADQNSSFKGIQNATPRGTIIGGKWYRNVVTEDFIEESEVEKTPQTPPQLPERLNQQVPALPPRDPSENEDEGREEKNPHLISSSIEVPITPLSRDSEDEEGMRVIGMTEQFDLPDPATHQDTRVQTKPSLSRPLPKIPDNVAPFKM